jgi:hypothetical protein
MAQDALDPTTRRLVDLMTAAFPRLGIDVDDAGHAPDAVGALRVGLGVGR